ncbi:hypothetical protein AWB74_02884 [Caballeronia arvi]|uniref:Uncharacterized protein n=1 Tax=Caballeronia arvi TaxID=1777135 RepID=A0A158IS68_9BURK|nr:hypothetical protein AWB74_02884 [Caballeronia arvi]
MHPITIKYTNAAVMKPIGHANGAIADSAGTSAIVTAMPAVGTNTANALVLNPFR